MWIIIVVIGLIFGLFAFSQIVFPLFVAWPKAKKLERENKLKKPIPVYTFLLPVLIWSVLLIGSIILIQNYFAEYLRLYYIVLGFIFVVTVAQIPMKNRDLEADVQDSFKPYLKDNE